MAEEAMFENIRQIIRSKLSNSQHALLRLIYRTIKNPCNIIRNINHFKYSIQVLHTSEINYSPPIFIAAITDNCNLRCPSCYYLLNNPDKFFSSFISIDEYKKVLEKYNVRRRAEIIFLGGGEPLLHPEFDELVDVSKSYELIPRISTNGILIKNNISSLKKLDHINVSVDSYNCETYNKYRGGTKKQFEMLKESLESLKGTNLNFSISFLLSTENVAEMPKMIEFAEKVSPRFIYFHNINPHGCEEYKPLTYQDKKCIASLNRIIDRSDYKSDIHISYVFDSDEPSFLEKKCIQPWYYFSYNSLGYVSPCCHLEHNQKLGNVFEDYDYNSPGMVKFRKNIMSGRISKSCLYCQRRFMEDSEFAFFDSRQKEWYVKGKSQA